MDSSAEELMSDEHENNSSGISGSRTNFRGWVLEPMVLLLFFAIDLSGIIIQNQIIYQTCTDVFGYNQSDCLLLGTADAKHRNEDIESDIQRYVAKIFMTRSILDGIVPAIGAIFVGAWSDKFGRKPIILVGLIGYFSMYTLCTALAYASSIYSINPWYYILMMVPKAILSAEYSLKSGAFAYIADVTDESNRMLRMTIYEGFLYMGIVTGFLSSSPVFHATNAHTVFAISGVIVLFALLLIWFGLKESVLLSEIDEPTAELNFFKWESVRESFQTAFKKRSRNDRAAILLVVSTLVLAAFIVDGSANVFFLFVWKKFGWTVKEYTIYQALKIAIQIVGNTVIVFALKKIFKASAVSVALLSFGSCTLDAIVNGTATASWELYVAAGMGILKGIPGAICRTILSSLISSNEIAKMFSLISAIQSITSFASAPFYTELYNKTLDIDPGVFNVVSAAFYIICFILMVIVFGIFKCYSYRGSRDLVSQ